MKCLVIGGSGFVGRWIVKELLDRGDEVINCDIVSPKEPWEGEVYLRRNKSDLKQILESNFMKDVNELYDMGAIVGTGGFSAGSAMRSLAVNAGGTLALLWAADNAGIKRYYYPAVPDDFANIYTVTKKAGEMFCKIFESKSGMEIKLLRWGNIYGPGQALIPRRLVPYAIMNLLAGKPVQIFGKGLQMVEMIHVKDAARITVEFMRNGPSKMMFDVDSPSFISVSDLVYMMRRLAESKSPVDYTPMRDGEEEVVDENPVGDRWLFRETPDLFKDVISLDTGLPETIEWYKERPWLLKEALEYYESLEK